MTRNGRIPVGRTPKVASGTRMQSRRSLTQMSATTDQGLQYREENERRTPSTDRLFARRHPHLDRAAAAQLHRSDLFDRFWYFGPRANSMIRNRMKTSTVHNLILWMVGPVVSRHE